MAHKNPFLSKRHEPKPRKKTPVSKAEKHSKARTGKLSKNSALQNSGAFVPLQRETLFFWQNPVAKAAKAVNRQTILRIRQSRILQLLHTALVKQETGKLSKNSALQNS